MPRWNGRAATSATSSSSLTTPNRLFSTSTQGAARKPTSTLSCSVKMAQATTEQTNTAPMTGPLSSE